MWPFSKPMHQLEARDLELPIEGRVRENISLEFKRGMYGGSDAEIKEMLRDVSSLGNAEGGALIVGMEEAKDGTAMKLHEIPNAQGQADRLVGSCAANISERIPGLQAVPVSIAGGDVAVVGIPRSYRRPHMITFRGVTDCWIRHDRQKHRMAAAEIRAGVTTTEDLATKVESFVERRRSSFANQGAPRSLWAARSTSHVLSAASRFRRCSTSTSPARSSASTPRAMRCGSRSGHEDS